MADEQVVRNVNDKANSFSWRWGGPGTDMKIYFNDGDDLEQQLIKLCDKVLSIKGKVQDFRDAMKEE